VIDEHSGPARIAELDSLRGILAVSIVIFHLYMQELFFFWSFVDGFLVLSGFVITRLLLANTPGKATLLNFYARRAIRIWPVYFMTMGVCLLLHCGYAIKNGMPLSTIKGIPQSIFFVQFVQFYWTPYSEYFTYDYIRWFGHSWSLAVEEQFYWLWPFLVFASGGRIRFIVMASIALILAGIWTRATGHLVFLFSARADGLALGSLLAAFELYVSNRKIDLARLKPALLAAFATIGALSLTILMYIYILPNLKVEEVKNLHYQDSTWLVLLFALVFVSIIGGLWLLQGTPALSLLRSRMLLWLGARSYAIYMFHPPIKAVMDRVAERLSQPYFVGAILTLVTTLLCAHLSLVLVESKFARLRSRFPMRPASPRGARLEQRATAAP